MIRADVGGTAGGAQPVTAVAFGFGPHGGGWHGEVAAVRRPADLRAAVERLVDPGASLRTLHWGRNVIYLTHWPGPDGPLPVAVKQFHNHGARRRLRRALRGSKAAKSWRVARAMRAAGLRTPEPVALVESDRPDGPSYYASRHLDGVLEARYLLRAANAGTVGRDFPDADLPAFLTALGTTLRRLHDAGFWHRDVSAGNVLIRWREGGEPPELYLLDLNRTRVGRPPTASERTRDLARMTIHRPEDQGRFLAAYWGGGTPDRGAATPLRRGLYRLHHGGFLARNAAKKAVRERTRGLVRAARDLVLPRGAHGHIPPPAEGARTRERVVWDHLSDQPHLHAGKLAKLGSRLGDLPAHAGMAAAAGRALPRTLRRYRELRRRRYSRPVPLGGIGVALRPRPEDPEGLLRAVDELGVRHALVRLHPWADDHDAEEELARELAARGVELAFALPQSRELVRDPARWRAAVEELAERFTPFGRHFQVGQAPNRSKWGVWSPAEWIELAGAAAEVLRRRPEVEVLGPAVIDFEPHATLGLVNHPGAPRFDALASLLYVDRRGAPENRQAGFDTADKVTLLAAIAETAERCGSRSWITEVNWPLREGPHAPAGQMVAVDEETQADYLVRYFVLALAAGHAERVYWWQLAARGYGLLDPEADGGLRRRPAFRALASLLRELAGATSLGPLAGLPPEARAFRFRRPSGGETVVAWSLAGAVGTAAFGEASGARGRDGDLLPAPGGRWRLTPSPVYLRLARGSDP